MSQDVFVLILLKKLTVLYYFFQLPFLAHKGNRGGLPEIKALLEKLPTSNYQLLKYLCNFLVKVSMNEGKFCPLSSTKHSTKACRDFTQISLK